MMTTSSSQAAPFIVVVGLDFRDAGGYAFAQAARVVHSIPGAQIHLVHVFEKELDVTKRAQLVAQLRQYANEQALAVGGLEPGSVGIHLRVGDAMREIVQLASDVSANLIVIGAHTTPHLKNWILGSVSHRLIEASPIPVLVAGPRPPVAQGPLTIEPPCGDCVKARAESKNARWWCERHGHGADTAHVYSYQREFPFSSHDSAVSPTGVEF